MICGDENDTNGCHLAVFSKDIAFAYHFMATHLSPTLPPCRSASGTDYASKKWWTIQLAIHSIVDALIEYK